MNILEDLMGCDKTWASTRAAQALHINSSLHNGDISKDEAVELLQDLVNTDALDKEATDFTVRTQLVTAIADLISVVSSIPGI